MTAGDLSLQGQALHLRGAQDQEDTHLDTHPGTRLTDTRQRLRTHPEVLQIGDMQHQQGHRGTPLGHVAMGSRVEHHGSITKSLKTPVLSRKYQICV